MFRPIVETLTGNGRRGFTPSRSRTALVAGITAGSLLIAPAIAGAASAAPSADAGVPILGVDVMSGGVVRSQVAPAAGTVDHGSAAVDLVSVKVDDGGARTLVPLGTGIDIRNVAVPADVVGVVASENGAVTAPSDGGFEAAAERAYNSTDLRDYIKVDKLNRAGTTWGADYDVMFASPVQVGQYLLVEERDGNAAFSVTAVDAAGAVVPGAPTVRVGAPYGWNTGYAPADYPEAQPVHLTVLDVAGLLPDGVDAVAGVRIDNDDEADIKLVPLADELVERAPIEAPVGTEGLGFAKTVYRGTDGGAGCATAAGYAEAGQNDPVTYCFTVTNTGTDALADISIVDPYVAVAPTLLSADSTPLAPGDSARYLVEAVPPADDADGALDETYTNVATASAQPVDGTGAPLGERLTATAEAIVYPAEALPAPAIELATTVYSGVDGGIGCPAADATYADEHAPITYCFVVTNTGNTPLGSVAVTAPELGVAESAGPPVLLSGPADVIAPGVTQILYIDAVAPAAPIDGVFATAAVMANPVDDGGADLTGLPDVFANDPAQILPLELLAATEPPAASQNAEPAAEAEPATPVAPPTASLESADAPTQLAFTGWATWLIAALGAGFVGAGWWLLENATASRAAVRVKSRS